MHHSKPPFAVVAAGLAISLLSACGAKDKEPIANVFDACEPLVVAPDESLSAERLASVREAVDMWNGSSGSRLVLSDDAGPELDDAPRLPLHFEKAAAAFHGFYDDEAVEVFINTAITDADERRITVAHEIGHAFGLYHVPPDERPSVMNNGNLEIGIMKDDVATLEATWGACGARANVPAADGADEEATNEDTASSP